MSDTTREDYWNHIRGVTQDIIGEIKAGAIENDDDLSRYVHESCDGSWWTIYTHANVAVMHHSDNWLAGDDFMGLEGCESMVDALQRYAYHAQEADIMAQLGAEGVDPSDPAAFLENPDDEDDED